MCGVILHEDAYEVLEKELAPYIQTGKIGKFIYCDQIEQAGSFMVLKISPELVSGRIKDVMFLYIPVQYVKFAVCGGKKESIGFGA